MDYSLSAALAYNLPKPPRVLLMYDIMCQYGVNLRRRFEQSIHLAMPPGIAIDKGIGLFHIHGHQDSCYPRYAPNFIPGSAQVDGEILETLWAPLIHIAGSTRAMTKAHRREILDDHMNDSNWKKMVRTGEFKMPVNPLLLNAHRGTAAPRHSIGAHSKTRQGRQRFWSKSRAL